MAVDNTQEFHKLNLKANKRHYTMFSRFTHGRAVRTAQKYGAKCHFNEIEVPKAEYLTLLEDQFEFPEE